MVEIKIGALGKKENRDFFHPPSFGLAEPTAEKKTTGYRLWAHPGVFLKCVVLTKCNHAIERSWFFGVCVLLLLLQEVGGGHPGWHHPLRVRHRLEDLGRFGRGVQDLQDRGHVATPVTVVGRTPHRHQLLIKDVLVTFWRKKNKIKLGQIISIETL